MDKRTIVITGVSRGLGRAMAIKFAALGHTVIGCSRSFDEIAALQNRLGPKHAITPVDLLNETAVKNWATNSIKKFGPPHLLLNNAAIINHNAPLWKVPAAEFNQVIDINIKGATNVLRHFLPAMVEAKTGIIVNFSSGWGRSTDAEVAPYCATKWAIEGLTQSLAQELPSGMAAIPLNPGIINTAMLQSCFGDSAAAYPSAEEWAERAVPFLLKLSPRDNGQQLTVN